MQEMFKKLPQVPSLIVTSFRHYYKSIESWKDDWIVTFTPFLADMTKTHIFIVREPSPKHCTPQKHTKTIEEEVFADTQIKLDKWVRKGRLILLPIAQEAKLLYFLHPRVVPNIHQADCIHYCLPGYPDVWVERMMHGMIHRYVSPEERPTAPPSPRVAQTTLAKQRKQKPRPKRRV